MHHCKRHVEARTVNIVHWQFNQSQVLVVPGKNNTMVGRQKLSLLDIDLVFLDFFF
jgi:hypothetical protein